MKREQIYEKVIGAIQSVINIEEKSQDLFFSEDISLYYNGLNLSSLDYVQFIVKIEELFGIQWPDEFLSVSNITIGEVISVIENCSK